MSDHNDWNKRYADAHYVYGLDPNEYLKQELAKLTPGKLLLPGEGEGRNALWAAKQGWDVTALDASETAQAKANKLFAENNVRVQYHVSDILHFASNHQFDAIGLVYVHLHKDIQQQVADKLTSILKPKGVLILEMFHPEQIPLTSGGPKNPEMFAELGELENQYKHLCIEELRKDEVVLNEGLLHKGKAIVIRMRATKP
ncbi:MAG: methyltransferase domain-containing protein [Tenuifilaceae bacterium]|nr:methyltransferase domain-containing protein [Tenuifilaceae bacterium]